LKFTHGPKKTINIRLTHFTSIITFTLYNYSSSSEVIIISMISKKRKKKRRRERNEGGGEFNPHFSK